MCVRAFITFNFSIHAMYTLTAMSKLTTELALLLDEGDLDSGTKHQWLNTLKMMTYLACNLMEVHEKEYTKPTAESLLSGKVRINLTLWKS